MLRRRQAKQQDRESRRSAEQGRIATPLDAALTVAQADAGTQDRHPEISALPLPYP